MTRITGARSRARTAALTIGSLALTATLLSACTSAETAKGSYADDAVVDGVEVIGQASLATGLSLFGSAGGDDDSFMPCTGDSSLNPVVVMNNTTSDQTFSVTINNTLSGEAQWIAGSEVATDPGGYCGDRTGTSTIDVTIPAGSVTLAGALDAGGGTYGTNNEGTDNNIAIGAGGEAWYDLWLHVDSATFAFESLELGYSHTGGLDSSDNVQSGLFNAVECTGTANANGMATSVAFSDPIALASPYEKNDPNAWKFGKNQPICFGFLDADTPTVTATTQTTW